MYLTTLHVYSGDGQTFVVTWTTFTNTSNSIAEFGTDPAAIDIRTYGHEELFVDGSEEQRKEYIHRVVFPTLAPKQRYCKSKIFIHQSCEEY